MAVQAFNPSSLPQSDTNWAVARRLAAAFAPRAASPENMTVIVEAGSLLRDGVLIESGVQVTSAFVRPTALRVDRVVISRLTGLVSVVAGTDGSMEPPTLPADALPCARVLLRSDTQAITNEDIIDERAVIDTTPVSSSPVVCRVSRQTPQTGIVNGSLQKILFTTVNYNIGNGYDITNNYFKPTVAGYYIVNLNCAFNLSAGCQINAGIYKNGSLFSLAEFGPGVNSQQSVSVSDLLSLNGTTDYLEFYTAQATGGTTSLTGGSFTFMSAIKVA